MSNQNDYERTCSPAADDDDQVPQAGAQDQPLKKPIFGTSYVRNLHPGTNTFMSCIKSLMVENRADDELFERTTVSSYLHLLDVDQCITIIRADDQKEKTFEAVEEFKAILDRPSHPIAMDLSTLKIMHILHFGYFTTPTKHLQKLASVSRSEKNAPFSEALPMDDFYELIKLFHFCGIAGNRELGRKVEHIFLRYLECLTRYSGDGHLRRLMQTSNEWFLLGNARLSRELEELFLMQVPENSRAAIFEEMKQIRAGN